MATRVARRNVNADGWFFNEYDVEADTIPLVPRSQARVSIAATFGLVLGLVALGATMTGLLALLGVAVGVVAVAVSAVGLIEAIRHARSGQGLAVVGAMCALGAVAIGLLAIGGRLSWLSSSSDTVGQLHDWLTANLPWLRWDG